MWKLSVSRPPPVAVAAPSRSTVDAAEAQGLLADVELVEAGQAGADDDVALLAELVGAAPALVEHARSSISWRRPRMASRRS